MILVGEIREPRKVLRAIPTHPGLLDRNTVKIVFVNIEKCDTVRAELPLVPGRDHEVWRKPADVDRASANRLRQVENDPGANVAQCRNDGFKINNVTRGPMVPLECRERDVLSTKLDGFEQRVGPGLRPLPADNMKLGIRCQRLATPRVVVRGKLILQRQYDVALLYRQIGRGTGHAITGRWHDRDIVGRTPDLLRESGPQNLHLAEEVGWRNLPWL